MNINDIKSASVRIILTGSATPALDILAKLDEFDLATKNEALAYYQERGGLQAHATAEHNFCIQFDC